MREGHFWIHCVTDFSWRDAKHTSIPTYTSPTPTHTNLHTYTYTHLLTTENVSAKPGVITYNIQFDERFLLGVNKKKCRWGLLARSSNSSNVAESLLSSPENCNHGTPNAIDRQLQGSNISFFPQPLFTLFYMVEKNPQEYTWKLFLTLQTEYPSAWDVCTTGGDRDHFVRKWGEIAETQTELTETEFLGSLCKDIVRFVVRGRGTQNLDDSNS